MFPAVVCTPGFASFADQVLSIPAAPVTIPNAFNSNDGPAPYTVVEAALMNLQLPLSTLTFTPLGGDSYTLSAGVALMVNLSYLDGNNVLRAKFVQAPVQLTGAVTSAADPYTVAWWAFVESGSISDPVLNGTTLGFTAAAVIHVSAMPDMPDNFPVLDGYACSQQAPVQAECMRMYPLESYCVMTIFVPGASLYSIPYAPLGPAPYSNPLAVPLEGPPYVLRATRGIGGATLLDLAFPIELSYVDGNSQLQTQTTFMYISLLMANVSDDPSAHVIVNLEVSSILLPLTVTAPVITPVSFFLSGNIAAIGDLAAVLVTGLVQCGEAPAPLCMPLLPPPTAEVTG